MNAVAPARTELIVIEVAPPASSEDWGDACALIQDLASWLEGLTGVSPEISQPGLQAELFDLQSVYAPPRGDLFLARLGGRSVGTTAIKLLTPEVAELKRVWVSPDARGYGLASIMLESAIVSARAMGARRLRLETHRVFMPAAVQMYRKRGFVEIPGYTGLTQRVPGAIAMELGL